MQASVRKQSRTDYEVQIVPQAGGVLDFQSSGRSAVNLAVRASDGAGPDANTVAWTVDTTGLGGDSVVTIEINFSNDTPFGDAQHDDHSGADPVRVVKRLKRKDILPNGSIFKYSATVITQSATGVQTTFFTDPMIIIDDAGG